MPELNDRGLLTSGNNTLVSLHRFWKSPLQHVSIGQQIVSVGISGIERDRGREIAFSLRPMITASIDVAVENKKRRAVRQTGAGDCEFGQRAVVITMASEQKIGLGEMGLGGIGT